MVARSLLCSLLTLTFALAGLRPAIARARDATPEAMTDGVQVVAAGLTNPRGFSWSPDGSLYMAMAGSGGETRIEVAEGFTLQLGLSSSVATIVDGCATPAAVGLVSALWVEAGWIWGAMDVAFLDEQPYVLVSGAGPSWLSPSSFSGVFRMNDDGTMALVADLTSWLPEHLPEAPLPPDYGSDGSLFDLEAAGDALLLSEAVGGLLIRVTPEGEISTLADLSEGHLVPTGIAVDDDGNAFVGFETSPPYADGASKVVMVTPDGTVSDAWTGLTAVTDVAIGPDGTLYAAEMGTGNLDEDPYLRPNSGRVVRQTGPDSLEEILTDAAYPVTIGFDPEGVLNVAYPAFAPDAGEGHGAILRVDPSAGSPISLTGFEDLASTCQGGPGSGGDDGTPGAMSSASGEDAAVEIADFAFDPVTVEIPAGTTLNWVNTDRSPHTATSHDGGFDTGRLDEGGASGVTFDAPGSYAYHCEYHPAMTGTVTVT